MPPRSFAVGLVHVTTYVLASLVWVVFLSTLTLALAVGLGGLDPLNMGSPEEFVQALGPGLLGASTILQGAGLVVIATLFAATLPVAGERPASLPDGPQDLRARLVRAFALRHASGWWYLAGGLGAITVGWLPSWILEQLLHLAPEGYVTTVELMAEQLLGGPAGGRAVLLASIVLGAPIFEELVFRGYLWEVLRRAGPAAFAWIGTSLLFAAYHQDPIHVTALLPTAFFIGALRLGSGSLWPAVLAHFVNNGVSAVALLTIDGDSAMSMPLWLAIAGYGFTCACCVGAWLATRRRDQGRSNDGRSTEAETA